MTGACLCHRQCRLNFSAFMRLHEAMLCAWIPCAQLVIITACILWEMTEGILTPWSVHQEKSSVPLMITGNKATGCDVCQNVFTTSVIKHLPHHVRDRWMEAWFFQYSGCSGTGISEPVGLPLQEAFCLWPEPGPYPGPILARLLTQHRDNLNI